MKKYIVLLLFIFLMSPYIVFAQSPVPTPVIIPGLLLIPPEQVCPTCNQESFVSLREYFERLIEEQNKIYDAQFANSALAVKTATAALEGRLDLLNEFRATLESNNLTFAPREVVDAMFERLQADNDDLREQIKVMQIAQSNLDGCFTAFGIALFFIVTLVNIGILKFFIPGKKDD